MTSPQARQLKLLPQWAVTPTSAIDRPDWNYHPLLARIQQMRFRMLLGLLGEARFDRLLDVGFGSGVFMPELAGRCAELHGIDPHPCTQQVRSRLAANRVTASLTQDSIEATPYPDGYFDCVVSVTALEFVADIDAACWEITRVLAPGGILALVTSCDTPLWDLAVRIATRQAPISTGDRRQRLQPTLRRHFRLLQRVQAPRLGAPLVRLYTGLTLRPN